MTNTRNNGGLKLRRRRFSIAALVLALALALWPPMACPTEAAVYTVDTVVDENDGSCSDGDCSLRDAIILANNNPGSDTINFNCGGACNIQLDNGLPTLTDDATIIDGSGTDVTLDGSNLMWYNSGLFINGASYVEIRGLQILHFPGSGIQLENASNSIIGGTNSGPNCTDDCNLISGNGDRGIEIRSGSTNNTVSGNYIGTNAAGTAALANGSYGIYICENSSYNVIGGGTSGPGGYCTGTCNLISGNGTPGEYDYGVRISGSGTDNNTVSGNYIGTNADGTAAIPNTYTGVSIKYEPQHNIIENNLISGNNNHGVDIWTDANYNVVRGNYIGTNASGTGALGNGTIGVWIALGAQNNTIGGDTAADRNLISGNGYPGILIETSSTTTNNTVKGNYIGTDVSGTAAVGNGTEGILIREGIQYTTIESNLISGNGSHGVSIHDSDTTNNTVTENSIYNNTGKGIKLDHGGNLELFAPIITSREFDRVSGSAPPYSTVEIFSDDEDEGQVSEGSTTADGSGNFAFDQPGGFTLSNVTATATDANGNTSEFSEEHPETHDMELVTIFSVKSKVSVGEAIMPAVEVGNAGSSTESSVPVQVRVTTDPGGTEVYSRTQTVGSINPLNYEFLEFEAWTPAATGNYRLEASVTLPGDGNTANDTKEVAIMAVMDNPEVYIKSKDGDDGSVPQYHYWKSPDLWVRHNQDGLEEHEQPIAGQTNYAYARVHNIGDVTLDDVTVDLYWHEPALGIKCGNWQHIGVYTITVLSPGVTETVHLPWTPDVSGHTCLFAQVDSAQDPYSRGHDCYEGVAWDNNLAQRNLEVVESAAAQVGAVSVAGIQLDVVNVRSKPASVDVVVKKTGAFTGTLTLDLGDELFNRWQNATAGTVKGGQVVSGTTKVQITAPVSGTMVGLPLYGDEEVEVVLEAEGQSGLEFEVEVVQWIDGLLIGGNTYLMKLPYHHIYLPIILKGHSGS